MVNEQLSNLEKGRDYYLKGEFEKAEQYLLKAAHFFKNYADVWNMLGVINNSNNNIKDAQNYFEKALAINPHYTDAALNLAVTYNEQGKYSKARQIHERAISFRKDAAGVETFAIGKITNMHADLAVAYAELKMFDKAVEQYRAALALGSDFIDIRTKFAQFLRETGDLEEAVVQLKTVLEFKKDYVPALLSLGMTYYAVGDKHNAEIYWEKVIEKEQNNKSAIMYLKMLRQMKVMDIADLKESTSDSIKSPPDSSKLKKNPADKQNDNDLIFTYSKDSDNS